MNNCYVCQKSIFNFDDAYVDEFRRPKYHTNDGIIFCSPQCSTDYHEQLKDKENAD